MIRFRHKDDERRWSALRAQIYMRIASHMPAPMIAEVMQNFTKLEEQLWLEGVRQGVACQSLAQNIATSGQDLTNLKAFQLHAHVYGSLDTPLRTAELDWLKKLQLPADLDEKGSLDDAPMRFAPVPVAENIQRAPTHRPAPRTTLPAPELSDDDPIEAIDAPEPPPDDEPLYELTFPEHADGPSVPLDSLFSADESAADEGVLANLGISVSPDDLISIAAPDALSRIRDTIQDLQRGGWNPTSWTELIMRLHITLHIDAAYLDIELSTDMGRTVLDQCGLYDIRAGYGVSYAPPVDE